MSLKALPVLLLVFSFSLGASFTDTASAQESTAVTVAAPAETTPETTPGAATAAPVETPVDPAQQEIRALKKELLTLREDVKRCTLLEERSIRMTCYDRVSAEMGYITAEKLAEEEKKLGEIGFWQLSTKLGSDGVQDTYVRLESSNKVRSKSGLERQVLLVIRCSPGKTDAFLDWKGPIFTGSRSGRVKTLPMTYFFNNEPAFHEEWQISFDRQALFSLDAISFVRSMMNKKKLTLEFSPGDNAATVHFDIAGIETAVNSTILKNCYQ